MRTTDIGSSRPAGRSLQRRIAAAIVGIGAAAGAAAGTVPARPEGRSGAVVRVSAGGERIAAIRTSRGVTTMLSLPAEATEAVCGDLFDPQTGNGCFVIQRSGRDLFLKPLRASGETNLFVKTSGATYAFDLTVVPAPRAMRIVLVETAAPDRALAAEREQVARERVALEDARRQFAAEREAAAAALDRQRVESEGAARMRAETIAREWLANGAAEAVPVVRRVARGRDRLEVTLGAAALRVRDQMMLRLTIRNGGSRPVVVGSAELTGGTRRAVPVAAVAPAGGEISVTLVFPDTPADRAASGELRLLDAGGVELARLKPFR